MPDNTRHITPLADTPVNRLFFAINHYVSTGDHIGEGVAQDRGGGQVCVLVPFNPRELEDKDNFDRLKARLEQLQQGRNADAPRFTLAYQGQGGRFSVWGLTIQSTDCDALADLLVEEPGPLGWGSCKFTIDAVPTQAWQGRLPGQRRQ